MRLRGANVLNNFSYESDIPLNIRAKLVEREPLCEVAVFETSQLTWSREVDGHNRALYILTKRGIVNIELCRFSEKEIFELSDEEFKKRVFVQDSNLQRDRDNVSLRIEEWRKRLSTLFAEIKSWLPRDSQIIEGEIAQRTEELMVRYGVTPKNLPTLAVLRGKHRISFVPSALWVIGADGRVNVTTNKTQLILVDQRLTQSSESQWKIVLRQHDTQAFTKKVLLNLLGGAA